jgi:hypothetical protein
LITVLITGAVGLLGVFLGGWLTVRHEREKRRSDFVTRQLSEFYGPLLSMSAEIRARGALRDKILQVSDQIKNDEMKNAWTSGHEAINTTALANLNMLWIMSKDEQEQFRQTIMPIYRRMLETFRDKIWLAEPETRGYLSDLIEVVEIFERILRQVIDPKVIEKLDQNTIERFYTNVEETHARLLTSLSSTK